MSPLRYHPPSPSGEGIKGWGRDIVARAASRRTHPNPSLEREGL